MWFFSKLNNKHTIDLTLTSGLLCPLSAVSSIPKECEEGRKAMKSPSVQIGRKGEKGMLGSLTANTAKFRVFPGISSASVNRVLRGALSEECLPWPFPSQVESQETHRKGKDARFFPQHSLLAAPPESRPRWVTKKWVRDHGRCGNMDFRDSVQALRTHSFSGDLHIPRLPYPTAVIRAWETHWPPCPEGLIPLDKLIQSVTWLNTK